MIIVIEFAIVTALWCLGIGGLVTAGIACFLLILLAAIVADPSVRQVSALLDEVLLDTLAMLGGKLPGPDRPQASGAAPDGDTHVKGWSAAEIAYLRGELKELPK